MRTEYIEKLAALMKESGMDAVLISPGEELTFFTGFSPMMCERFQGLFVKQDGTCFYVCNLLYGDQLRSELGEEVPVYTWFDNDEMTEIVDGILEQQGLKGKTIGVNSTAQAFNVLDIAEKSDITFRNAKPLLEEVRIHKTLEEQEYLRQSAAIADAVFLEALDFIKPGKTEGQIMDFLFERMQARGASFVEAIVASGPNASYPHYEGRDRVIQEKDIVLLDYGCAFHEMMSDMSRTVFVGGISEYEKQLYDLVERANAASEALAKEGAWIPDIDKAAREVLDEQGLAKTLVNRVGHGIGYSTHEGPYIKQSNPRRLERGMAFSIEPGVYLSGEIGMRLEDIVMINDKGETEVLNKSPREPMVVCPIEGYHG